MAAEAIARNLVTPVFPVTSHTGNLGNPESLSVEGLGTGVLPLMSHQQGQFALEQLFARDTAHQRFPQSGMAIGTHDDGTGIFFPRKFFDHFGHLTLFRA